MLAEGANFNFMGDILDVLFERQQTKSTIVRFSYCLFFSFFFSGSRCICNPLGYDRPSVFYQYILAVEDENDELID